MSFIDVYLPDRIKSFDWLSSPRFSTTITSVSNASEHRNQNWLNPLVTFKSPGGVRCHGDLEDLRDHWMVMRGPLNTFPLRDPLDFASARLQKANLRPTITITDQLLGIADGVRTQFQLVKTYQRGIYSYTRRIATPVIDSVMIGLNAIDVEDSGSSGGPYSFEVDRLTGIVTLDHPPGNGGIITAGYIFDCQARFLADDSFDQVVKAFQTDGFSDLDFTEVRPCGNGDSSQ